VRPSLPLVLLALAGAGRALASDPATLQLYQAKCFSCHLAEGKGPLPPMDFSDGLARGSSPAQVAQVISEGVPGTAMLGFKEQLTPAQIAALARLVRSYDKTAKAAKPARKGAAGR
jgi:mono/diheme cytochrome c family protein